MERLNIDELIYISEREAKEQQNTIKYLEEMEEFKYYIAPHREAKKKCEQIAEYFKELKQYKDLEEQGLLLRFPCKVGDTVYTLHKNIVKEEKVYDVQYRGIKYKQGQRWFMNIGATVYFEMDFGKSVFLTQAEAEQKLKEMEENKDLVR